MDCYTINEENFKLAWNVMPFTLDVTDLDIKKLITTMCEFYHDKTGKWINLAIDRELMEPYDQEFWNKYPINELPTDLVKWFRENSKYSNQ